MNNQTDAQAATADDAAAMLACHQSVLVNVGYGRDARSVACANAFIDVWQAGGGEIGAIVSCPAAAASWLQVISTLLRLTITFPR